MFLLNLDLLSSDPARFMRFVLIALCGLIIAITVHEFSHAYIAFRLGDDTAHRQGRISLNPLVHLDLMGTLLLLLVGFGWGKPVPVNKDRLRRPVRRNMAAVSAAGIIANLLIAAAIAFPFRYINISDDIIIDFVVFTVRINIVIAFFNILPVPPLDGFNILSAALPDRIMQQLVPVIRWIPLLLLAVLIIDTLIPVSVIGAIIGWPVNYVTRVLFGVV